MVLLVPIATVVLLMFFTLYAEVRLRW